MYLFQIAARRDQLVRQARLHRAGSQERFGQRDQRRIACVGVAAPRFARDRAGRQDRRRSLEQVRAPALDERRCTATDLAQRVRGPWVDAWQARAAADPVAPGRRAGPVEAVRSRHAARRLATARGLRVRAGAHAWQPFPHGLRIALIGGGLEAPTPPRPPNRRVRLAQAALDLVGELQEVDDVLGGVS